MTGVAANCYDLVTELDPTMQELGQPDYFLLGGIVTGALKHADVVFDHEAKRVAAPPGSSEPAVRENGSHRDIDILVPAVLSEETAETIKERLIDMVDDQLVVSVFGFEDHKPATLAERAKLRAADWTSRRTVDEEGVLRYSLWPLEQTVKPESYEPWRLELPSGAEMKMLNPAAHMLAYRMRSISGLRKKDAPKVSDMTRQIVDEPEFREQIMDGPLRSWRQFADAIITLRDGRLGQADREPVAPRPGGPDQALFFAKGNILRLLEKYETIVNIGQSDWMQEHILNIFVRAK